MPWMKWGCGVILSLWKMPRLFICMCTLNFRCWMGQCVCRDYWMPVLGSAIALTDKGNLFGAIDFYFGAKSKGVHPIVGCELFFC